MGQLAVYRRVFRNGRLTRLLLGEFVSSIGDWLYMVAMLVVVYEVAREPFLLGLIGALRILPYAFLSVPAGILADRFDRRNILIATDVVRGAVMVVLAILVMTGAPVLAIIAFALLATCAAAFFGPAIAAYLPSLVEDETDLGPANSAWATLDNLAFIIGPGVAGVLIAVGGLGVGFVLNAISFGVVALMLLTLPPGRPGGAQTDGDRAEAAAEPAQTSAEADSGWRQLVPRLSGPLVLDAATSVAGGGLGVLTVLIAVDQLNAGEEATGYLNAAVGVGGVVASLAAGLLTLRRLDASLLGGAFLGAAGLVLLGVTRDLGVALVAMGLGVGAILLLDILNTTLLQRAVPDELRGRAMGVLQTSGTIAYALGSFALPVLAGVIGVPIVLIVSGGILAAMTVLGVALLRPTGALAPSRVDPARVALLRQSPLGALPGSRLEVAARQFQAVPVTAGQVVIEQGAEADRFYVIESGRFRVTQVADDGQEQELRVMGPGEVFGQIGLLTAGRRTANVTAEGNGQLYALDRSDFLELVGAGPGLSTRLLDLHRGALAAARD